MNDDKSRLSSVQRLDWTAVANEDPDAILAEHRRQWMANDKAWDKVHTRQWKQDREECERYRRRLVRNGALKRVGRAEYEAFLRGFYLRLIAEGQLNNPFVRFDNRPFSTGFNYAYMFTVLDDLIMERPLDRVFMSVLIIPVGVHIEGAVPNERLQILYMDEYRVEGGRHLNIYNDFAFANPTINTAAAVEGAITSRDLQRMSGEGERPRPRAWQSAIGKLLHTRQPQGRDESGVPTADAHPTVELGVEN